MKKLLLYIGIALTAIGCTKEINVDLSDNNALFITSNIASRAEKTVWESGNFIGVYATNTALDSAFGGVGANVKYTSDGSDNFTSADPIYFLLNGTIDLLAYYPYLTSTSFDPTKYPIISEDQDDLLSAKKESVTSSTPKVEMTFYHRLSKISLTIENGDGLTADDLQGLSVKLSNISTTATFDLTSNATTTTNSASDLTLTTATNGTSSSAIVIPQTLSSATLYFTTTNHGTLSSTLTTSEFKTGLEYKYTATLNRTGVDLAVGNIGSWGGNTTESGTASAVDINYNSEGVYEIFSSAGLWAFAGLVNGATSNTKNAEISGDSQYFNFDGTYKNSIHGKLMADIDLKDAEWTPMGDYSNQYSGNFDGNNHLISGLMITNENEGRTGLFGSVSGTVSNLGVDGSVSGIYVGGIAGSSERGTIINCYNMAAISSVSSESDCYSGGVVGYNYQGTVTGCYNSYTVNSDTIAGGVAGCNIEGTITNCYNTYTITGYNVAGGIVGDVYGGTITNCYNTWGVYATASGGQAGGIAGGSKQYSVIANCYNSGRITSAIAAGISGTNDYSEITNCYAIGQLVGTTTCGIVRFYSGSCSNCYYDSSISGNGSDEGGSTTMTSTDMKADSFAVTLNENAYYYNQTSPTVKACAWLSTGSSTYPSFDYDSEPSLVD